MNLLDILTTQISNGPPKSVQNLENLVFLLKIRIFVFSNPILKTFKHFCKKKLRKHHGQNGRGTAAQPGVCAGMHR